jgi:hypothetical protein
MRRPALAATPAFFSDPIILILQLPLQRLIEELIFTARFFKLYAGELSGCSRL